MISHSTIVWAYCCILCLATFSTVQAFQKLQPVQYDTWLSTPSSNALLNNIDKTSKLRRQQSSGIICRQLLSTVMAISDFDERNPSSSSSSSFLSVSSSSDGTMQPFDGSDSDDMQQQNRLEPSRVADLYLQTLTEALQYEDDIESAEQEMLDRKKAQRAVNFKAAGAYSVTLPFASSNTNGLQVVQIEPGKRIGSEALDLDSLNVVASLPINTTAIQETLDPTFKGLCVASVIEDSPAWKQGVRPGHLLSSISATIGDSLWPTSTVQGVRSALSSRKLTSGSVSMELQVPTAMLEDMVSVDAKEVDGANTYTGGQFYELTLPRPLGFSIQETDEGYVEVASIQDDKASNLVQKAIRVGDRVVAVDSSLGGQMWPVSTVEGVISACTGRLPGKPVTLRFERTTEIPTDESVQTLMESPSLQTDTIDKIASIDVASTSTPTDQRNTIKKMPPSSTSIYS